MAPTTWNRLPTVVNLSPTMRSTVTATPIQKIGLMPRIRVEVQSERPSGTALCTGKVVT